MIQLENLSFGYNKKKLLYNDLNLKLEPGSIYGLLGKNGAGKSTLLKIITGMLFPSKGEILVNGQSPKKRLPSFLESIYFIPEEVDVPPLTIKRYTNLFAPFYKNFNEKQLYTFLDELEVNHKGKLTELSFGQQKKFIIAFALACNTQVLILDEPTNGLDIPSKSWFRKLISLALNEQRTIIISTHQVRDLDNLIDQVLVLEEGRLMLNKTMAEIGEKLCFKTLPQIENKDDILYSESSLKGYSVVCKNIHGEDTRVNLEHLFNALTQNPEKLTAIFNQQ